VKSEKFEIFVNHFSKERREVSEVLLTEMDWFKTKIFENYTRNE
jgi:hypothetical protein